MTILTFPKATTIEGLREEYTQLSINKVVSNLVGKTRILISSLHQLPPCLMELLTE